MDNLIEIATIAGIALLGLLTIGFIFARLYKRSTKELAFVRTGLGGQRSSWTAAPSCCRCSTSACSST